VARPPPFAGSRQRAVKPSTSGSGSTRGNRDERKVLINFSTILVERLARSFDAPCGCFPTRCHPRRPRFSICTHCSCSPKIANVGHRLRWIPAARGWLAMSGASIHRTIYPRFVTGLTSQLLGVRARIPRRMKCYWICLRPYRAVRGSTSVSQPREGGAALRPASRAPRPHRRGGAVSRADPPSNSRELARRTSRGLVSGSVRGL
jgi:hypothetical protein